MPRWTNRDIKIEVLHPSTNAVLLNVSGKGDLSIDGFMPDNVNTEAVYDRSGYQGLVETQDGEQSLSWSIGVPNATLTDPTAYKYLDLVNNTGAFAAIPTADPGGRAKTHKIRITIDASSTNTGITLNSVRLSGGLGEGTEVVLNASGTNYNGFTLF